MAKLDYDSRIASSCERVKKFINAVLHETESVHCLNDVYVRAGKRVFRVVLKVAHLNFYEAHHPNPKVGTVYLRKIQMSHLNLLKNRSV